MTALLVAMLLLASATWIWPWGRGVGLNGWSVRRPLTEFGDATSSTGPARRAFSRRRRAATERAEAEALDLLDALAPALRAGLPPVAALRLIASTSTPGRGALTGLDAAAARGDPLAPTWYAYADASSSEDLRLVAGAWSLCETLGSPLASTVSTVSDVVRRRRAVRHRTSAALAGPQATMRVLTALPLSGPFVALAVGVSPADLYAEPAGAGSLVAGVALLLAGRAWVGRLVRGVTLERHGHPDGRRSGRSGGRPRGVAWWRR